MDAHLPALLAAEEVRQRNVASRLTGERAYTLTLAMTGDVEQAEIAEAKTILDEIAARGQRYAT